MGYVMKISVPSYHLRPGYAFVLEWNLPFLNPESATENPTLKFICSMWANVCALHKKMGIPCLCTHSDL